MSTPVWIDCASVESVPDATAIAQDISRESHVVLRFPSLDAAKAASIIGDLSLHFADCTVFRSSPTLSPASVTVKLVVADLEIEASLSLIREAIDDYHITCRMLVDQENRDCLESHWACYPHGEHIRFENRTSGQIVEAPDCPNPSAFPIDPSFFAEFVKSTDKHSRLASLIQDNFHNAERILQRYHQMTEPPNGKQ